MPNATRHKPTPDRYLPLWLAVVLSALGLGCARVSAAPAAHLAHSARCRIAWEPSSPAAAPAQYEWIGEVELQHHDGHIRSTDRALLEQKACSIGGDALSLTSHAKRTNSSFAQYGTLVFDVYRVRSAHELDLARLAPTQRIKQRGLAVAPATATR